MPAIDEYQGVDDGVKQILAAFFWQWFRANAYTQSIRINFWIFHKTLPLAAFQPVLELFFGPETSSVVA